MLPMHKIQFALIQSVIYYIGYIMCIHDSDFSSEYELNLVK